MTPQEQAAFDKLKAENERLKFEVERLNEQLKSVLRKLYGPSSEQSATSATGQTSLFNDETGVFPQPESTGKQIKSGNLRQTKRSSSQTKITRPLPSEKTIVPLKETVCDRCGETYHIFKKQVGRKLEYRPASVYIRKIYREVGKCQHCSADETFDGDKLVNAPMPAPLITRSLASASLVAAIVADKYELALPLDRQRSRLAELGLQVSEPTICHWVIKSAEQLTKLSDYLLVKLKARDHLHGDETPIQVLREPGKKATSKSYLWELRSIDQDPQPIIYFAYAASRQGAVAEKVYDGFTGTLVCDGYSGYNQLAQSVTRSGCWAHVRRKFWEAAHGVASQRSQSRRFVTIIDRLFRLERQLSELTAEQRLIKRQQLAAPILAEFWHLIDQTTAIPKSKLGKAIAYAIHQRAALAVPLTDPQVAISNNLAERSIKHTVIGRKNWLFSTSQAGAKANAVFLSLFETAKANGLNFRQYLTYLFEKLPQLGEFPTYQQLEAYLPWHPAVQQSCTD